VKNLLPIVNFDTKSQEGITNITIWFVLLVYFLFLHLFIVPILVSFEKDNYVLYAFLLFVPAATKLIFFSEDAIAYRTNADALFFQAQLPDKYIAEKYQIALPRARHLWFRAFDRRKDANEGEVLKTIQYGFTCRLVYHTKRISFFFLLLSTILFTASLGVRYLSVHGWTWFGWKPLLGTFTEIPNWPGKLLYIAHLLLTFCYLANWHNSDGEKPTGVWIRWREVNLRNKAWIDRFATVDELQAFGDSGSLPPTRPSQSLAPETEKGQPASKP
jgi:hypothetical protein